MLFPVNKQIVFDCLLTAVLFGIVLQLSVSCRNNGGIIILKIPKNMGFIKVSKKESKNGKKPRIITDQANYLKLLFHCHVLKFLWCKKRKYFDWEYSPGSLKTWASIWKLALERSLQNVTVCHWATKSRHENWTPLGLRCFCCWQIDKLVTNQNFCFTEMVIQNTIKPLQSSFFSLPAPISPPFLPVIRIMLTFRSPRMALTSKGRPLAV